jgi:hypothetical protein
MSQQQQYPRLCAIFPEEEQIVFVVRLVRDDLSGREAVKKLFFRWDWQKTEWVKHCEFRWVSLTMRRLKEIGALFCFPGQDHEKAMDALRVQGVPANTYQVFQSTGDRESWQIIIPRDAAEDDVPF